VIGPDSTATRSTTFVSLYSDETRDPYLSSYERIMTRFDADRQDAPEGAALYEQVVSLGATPQA
jgi:hypothetical protein